MRDERRSDVVDRGDGKALAAIPGPQTGGAPIMTTSAPAVFHRTMENQTSVSTVESEVDSDALIRVVDKAVALDAVEGAVAQPFLQVACGQPLAPSEAKHLLQLAVVDGDRDGRERKPGKHQHQLREFVHASAFQCVIEIAVPCVQSGVDADRKQVHCDDRDQQPSRGSAFLRDPIRSGKTPCGDTVEWPRCRGGRVVGQERPRNAKRSRIEHTGDDPIRACMAKPQLSGKRSHSTLGSAG
jgi:hypothetical protein